MLIAHAWNSRRIGNGSICEENYKLVTLQSLKYLCCRVTLIMLKASIGAAHGRQALVLHAAHWKKQGVTQAEG
jgi:hypothetical protein